MRRLSVSACRLPILLTVLLAACASAPKPDLKTEDDPFVGFLKPYKHCRERYAEMDTRVEAAGVRDAGYYRVPGFPYFRTDRVLASFANEVNGIEEISGWMRRMREFDQEAREFEYINLGMSPQERAEWRYDLLACGSGLAGIELNDPAVLARLRAVAMPPNEYANADAPTAAPLKENILQRQAAILRDFATPLAQLKTDAPLRLWNPRPVEDYDLVSNGYGRAIIDELGVPGLVDSQWRALAEIHSPALWIETASERDQPGTPGWSNDGAVVDPTRPQINYQVSFTRFGGARLMQINYFIWFRGSSSSENIDGMIWRVTLDDYAQPLVYESVHATGRDHLWFPAQALTRRVDAGDTALIPQSQLPKGPLALRLQAGTHALRRVIALDQAIRSEPEFYELSRYEDLFTLPKPDGATRNLFGPDGLIPGVQQLDLAWLWGSRVNKPGALRELGRIPISYAGQSHFDDAFLMEKLFVPSAAVAQAPNTAPDLEAQHHVYARGSGN